MGEIQIGDEVIAGDGSATKVVGVYPQGVKSIYRVTFSDGSSTECCKEHLWRTQTYAVDAAVAKVTDETLRKYAEDLTRNAEAFKKALENPETLEEFEIFIRFKGIEKLRPKQAAFYKELKAREQLDIRNRYGDPKTVVEGFSQEVHLAGPFSSNHPKKNIPLWIVKIDREKHPEKLPLTLFKELCRMASMFGGWWSSYVPEQSGFQFKAVEAARHFMAFVTGSVDRANVLATREERKVEAAAETLGTKAETLATGAEGAEFVPVTTLGA